MPEIGAQEIELNVRIVLSNDSSLDATIFPLMSHRTDAPIDTLAGFLNKRRRDFFACRLADATEMLIQLPHCYVFELTHQSVKMMRSIHTYMNDVAETSNPAEIVSYAPVGLTLTTQRIIRGDLWFYQFEPEAERNVAAGLNREARYVCVHGDKSTFFVRRSCILRASMAGAALDCTTEAAAKRSTSVRQTGLIDKAEVGALSADGTPLRPAPSFASALLEGVALPPPPLPPPTVEAPVAPLGGRAFPFAPTRRPGSDETQEREGEKVKQGIDPRLWY